MSGNGTTQSEAWTILRLLQWTTEHLKKNGSSSPRLDAEVLLAEARKCQRIDLYTAFNEEPNEDVKSVFRDWVKRRAAGEPVAYLVGKKEFYSLPFQVTRDCLIPRGETEHVVIECLDRIKKQFGTTNSVDVVDVGTGSGCIAISVARHALNAKMKAIDVSLSALEVARGNAERNGVLERIQFIESDLLSKIDDLSVDFVLSNPPYISDSEFEALEKTVRDFEPKLALVSGPQGTEIIDRLIGESQRKLRSNGWMICEISPMIAEVVLEKLNANQAWCKASCVRDMAGLRRVVVAQKV